MSDVCERCKERDIESHARIVNADGTTCQYDLCEHCAREVAQFAEGTINE